MPAAEAKRRHVHACLAERPGRQARARSTRDQRCAHGQSGGALGRIAYEVTPRQFASAALILVVCHLIP